MRQCCTPGRLLLSCPLPPLAGTSRSTGHAVIDFKDGNFYLENRGPTNCAAIRIASGLGQRGWPLPVGSAFSAGNSVFVVKE
jgi:hypothetical protein